MSNIEVNREDLKKLFDMCVNSMDFGSGFLDTEDVECLRKVARVIGVAETTATPAEFMANYPHEMNALPDEARCRLSRCNKTKEDPIHQTEAPE